MKFYCKLRLLLTTVFLWHVGFHSFDDTKQSYNYVVTLFSIQAIQKTICPGYEVKPLISDGGLIIEE